jgi:uncharacterized membrane protein
MQGTRGYNATGYISENPSVLLFLGFPLFLMNVIIFIISVLKLLFMHGKYFFLAFAVIMVLASPAAGSLTKITAGAPVYMGEKNLDISAGLQGCRVIDWWGAGADTSAPPQKNVTIIKTLDDSDIAFSYTISPDIYTGSEGTWYCEGKKPLRPVFEVLKPQLTVRFWDLDHDADVTGKTIPVTANITYRVDTNLDKALQSKYRPDMTSLDSFYTVTLADPVNTTLLSIYTGSFGKAGTVGLIFDRKPIITVSPYFWKDGSVWDRTSKNKQGDLIYSPGTYSIAITQNLNHMDMMYTNLYPDERIGLLESSASVTFIKPESTPVQTVSTPGQTPAGEVITTPAATTAPILTLATTPVAQTSVPAKTTYSPLPLWVVLVALGMAFACASRPRK